MTELLICSYNDFSNLAHIPKGKEAKFPLYWKGNKYFFKYNNNPAFVLKHPVYQYYYICNESIFSGSISTFLLKNNELKLINTVSSCGKSSCYLVFDKNLEYIININYWDSIISVHPLKNNIVQKASQIVKPRISNNINKIEDHLKDRQATSHHHSCVFYGDKLYVPDLGTDKIDIYNYKNGKLTFAEYIQLKRGSGPRYTIIHNDHIYIINELSSSLSVIDLNDTTSKVIQNITTLPNNFIGKNTCGSIQINRDKKIIYASNRGHDSIACFKILDNNTLELIEIKKTLGKTPRHFCISNCLRKIHVANQDSNNIVTFNITNSGKLEYENISKCNSPNFIIDTK